MNLLWLILIIPLGITFGAIILGIVASSMLSSKISQRDELESFREYE